MKHSKHKHQSQEIDEYQDISLELEYEDELMQQRETTQDEDSHYAELYIRGIVPETDDPLMPSLTLRMALLGTIWGFFLSIINGVFSFRTNAFSISSNVAALLSYPTGIFMARVLPKGILNPGPFTIKEHALIYIIASSAGGAPYGIENVFAQAYQEFFNDPHVNIYNSLLFILSTQMIGYGLSGFTRRYLVKPAAMFWPTALPTVALFVSFHEKTEDAQAEKERGGRYTMSRYTFFCLAFVAMFCFQWMPSFFLTSLQAVSLLCMFSNGNNKVMSFLGSASYGMGPGVMSLSFDWTNIGSSCITWPFWASLNYFIANVVVIWTMVPLAYYQNWFGNPPLNADGSTFYFNDNKPFPSINRQDLYSKGGYPILPFVMYSKGGDELNLTVYDRLKPIYMTEHFAMNYFTSFMALTCGISHVAVWYYKDIARQTREMIAQVEDSHSDVHGRLMRVYPDIPEWMYLGWFVFWFSVMMLVGQFTPFRMYLWAAPLGILVAMVFIVPYGVIQASTGQQLGLNIIAELVMGLLSPGFAVPIMTFKSYTYNIMAQCLALSLDLKIAHYLHINPVHLVISQLWGSIIGAIGNTASVWIAITYFPLGTSDWLYIQHWTFFNAGAIWGAIGPMRFFGLGSPYFVLNLGYLLGIILPLLPWAAHKVYPHPYWRFINFPIMCFVVQTGTTQSSVLSNFLISFVFMYLIFTYYNAWWTKYNYVLSAALDTGSGLSVVVSTLISLKFPRSPSAYNPVTSYGVADYYCTGASWESDQFDMFL